MTEKELNQYSSLKQLIEHKKNEIEHLFSKEITTLPGKVKGSSNEFPYIEVRSNVLIDEPREVEIRNTKVEKCKEEIRNAEKKIQEIEDLINDIDDPELRLLFELRCYQKRSWMDISTELSLIDNEGETLREMDRTTYSKKFKKYLKKFP